MKKNVIAVFDVGKTNKKVILFDEQMNLVFQEEVDFFEVKDEDGFDRDDVEGFLNWMSSSLEKLINGDDYNITALNFSTYGATMVFLDENGGLAAPVYNYLKPMPKRTLDGFYEKYGGVDEFSRKTASPSLDMLNSGLQILYVKKNKPDLWAATSNIVHFPQYLSFLYSGKIVSEYTSIGCHTALWDFDKMEYHPWLEDEGVSLPVPVSNGTVFECDIFGKKIKTGIGIHDSSASLVPYLKASAGKQFVLISSGTWAINMNPFSKDKLTTEQLKMDCLCYLSANQQQVKASRLFLGHIHELNVAKLSEFFHVPKDAFRNVKADISLIKKMLIEKNTAFFPHGIPAGYIGNTNVLNQFKDFRAAYHQLMYELTMIEAECIRLVLDRDDETKDIFITGGFVKNDIFTRLLATLFPNKKVYTADIYNASALGAAMMVAENIDSKTIKVDRVVCEKI